MTFESLQLIPQLLRNVERSGYDTPTPIQSATAVRCMLYAESTKLSLRMVPLT